MSKKSKEDGTFDLEQQFVLRLPPALASTLSKDLQTGSSTLKDKLSIELKNDFRHGIVRYGGHMLAGKMVDLPCVVESLKTTDNKTFYKTGDINQMLICSTEVDSPDETESSKKKDKEKRYQWNHGLTPPLKNVRKRRFRKVLKKKYLDMPEIEREVKRLFRADAEATKVKFEIIADDETAVTVGTEEKAALGESELFGELSSDEDGSDRSPEKSANFTYSDTDDTSRPVPDDALRLPHTTGSRPGSVPPQSSSDVAAEASGGNLLGLHLSDDDEPSSMTDQVDVTDEQLNEPSSPQVDDVRLAELNREASEIREQIVAEQAKIDSTDNPVLKKRFTQILESLEKKLSDKELEIQSLY